MSNASAEGVKKKRGLKEKYRDEYADMAGKLALLGYPDCKIASFLNVANVTVHRWKKSHEAFSKAINDNRAIADSAVAQALYQRAMGYSAPAVDIKAVDGVIVQTEYIKHFPPDSTACIFWLKNRQKDIWKDRPQPEALAQTIAETKRIEAATEKIKAETELMAVAKKETPVNEILAILRGSGQ